MYVDRLVDLGLNKEVNHIRLKIRVFEKFPDGKNTVIVFEDGIRNILKKSFQKWDFTEEVAVLAKAAIIIQNDVFNHSNFTFSGSFPQKCQENSLPSSLTTFA